MMEKQIGVFIVAIVISLILTPVFRWVSRRLKFFDLPGPLKSHKEPTPYLGGVAVYSGFVIPLLALTGILFSKQGLGILVGGSIILIMGLIDDAKKLPFYVKLIIQSISALCLVFASLTLTIKVLPLWANSILTIIWVVGITNALNIIDILDGLSAGVSFISALVFFFLALLTGNTDLQFISLALAGATLGFLKYNFPRASIFMGDTGSGFIGFVLACLAMGESYTGKNNMALFTPILILGVPIYDTILVTVFRLKNRKSIFKGSKDHLALRLTSLGLSRAKAVLFIYLITLLLGIISLAIVKLTLLGAIICYIVLCLAGFWGGRVLSKVEVE